MVETPKLQNQDAPNGTDILFTYYFLAINSQRIHGTGINMEHIGKNDRG